VGSMRRDPAKPTPAELVADAHRRIAGRYTVERNGCWIWNGHTKWSGYPITIHRKREYLISRIMLAAVGREPEPHEVARHTCDNRRCINPDHLIAGSQAENVEDAWIRGRVSRGSRHYAAILNEAAVRIVRSSHETNAALARQLGVSPATISDVRRRVTWSHV
jgi:hypothetical protein